MQVVSSAEEIKSSLKSVIVTLLNYSLMNKSSYCLQQLQKLKFQNSTDQKLFQLALSYILHAERIAAGGYDGFIAALRDPSIKLTNATSFRHDDMQNLMRSFTNKINAEMLNNCFELVGLHGKVILSQHPVNGNVDVAELNTSCFFPELIPAYEIKSTKFLNPRLICIDGFIESITEIHRLLEDAASLKETIILFVRGLSEEVIHTLKVNYDRGTIQVIPVIVRYDLDGVNLLNDVAVTNFSDVISANKGQLINNVDITNFSRVESVDITSAGTLIENQLATTSIDSHIYKLQQKINSSINQYEKDMLTKRIQNLGMNRITIRLKDDSEKKQRSLEIDRALRAIKDAGTYGICKLENKLYPYAGLTAGIYYANKFLKTATDLGAILND